MPHVPEALDGKTLLTNKEKRDEVESLITTAISTTDPEELRKLDEPVANIIQSCLQHVFSHPCNIAEIKEFTPLIDKFVRCISRSTLACQDKPFR